MNLKINQKDINNAAWAACDTFRGVMDAAGYKDYILVMLFVKYISDVWKGHYEEYQRQYGDDDARIRRKLQRERFVLPHAELKNPGTDEVNDRFLADFYSLYERRNAANIGELINITLDAIEEANKVKLEGVFRNIDFNSEANLGKTKDRNRRLKLLLEDFHKPQLDMSPSRVSEDVIGNTYIYLIERFASDAGKKAGEFYTPHKVSELVAKLSGPKSGDRICDPACGSGGLLIEATREVGDGNYALFGMEVNGSTWALARMNMFLHKADSARIEWCNTLTGPALVENDRLMKFNIVVGLPGNLFPTTSIPVAILVFDRSWEKGGANQRRKDVLFVDASREYLSGKNQNALSDAHIDKILKTVKARKVVDKYAHVAKFDEIKENDFNLNIPRYVDTFEEEEEIDIDAVQQEIDALEKELVQVRAKMATKLKEIER